MLQHCIEMFKNLTTQLTVDLVIGFGLIVALILLILYDTSEQALLALSTGLVGYLGRGSGKG